MSKRYTFVSKNMGDVTVTVTGEYHGEVAKDFDVWVEGLREDHEFEECDQADDIIRWLADKGVEFESERSMVANARYINSVMIDRDRDESWVWAYVDSLPDEDVAEEAALILA